MRMLRPMLLILPFLLLLVVVALPEQVAALPAPPSAGFTYDPIYPDVGQNITFNASYSSGTGLTYSWKFGDHTTGSGMEVMHVYNTSGYYTVYLVVTDAYGRIDTTSDTLSVQDNALNGVVMGMMFGILALEMGLIGCMLLAMVLNMALATIFAIKMHIMARDAGFNKDALPYLIGVIITGAVGLTIPMMSIPGIIISIVIFMIFRSNLRKWKENGPPRTVGAPPVQQGYYYPPGQPPNPYLQPPPAYARNTGQQQRNR